MKIVVSEQRCPQNHKCPLIKICPVNAISQDGFNLPVIDYEKCIKCKKCVMRCPMNAMQIQS